MKVSDFDYYLPEELIAQKPLKERTAAKMMVINRAERSITTTTFADFPKYLKAGDTMVFNDTKVIPARIYGNKVLPDGSAGARIEALLLEDKPNGHWKCMIRPAKRLKPGAIVQLTTDPNDAYELVEKADDGSCSIRFLRPDVLCLLDEVGHIPLPPYIQREDTTDDREDYQTVFADKPGAVAAPTAGLHFTPGILDQLQANGVQTTNVTLHVGAGTFKPVQVDDVNDHKMHSERYILSPETADLLNQTRQSGSRICAIGTTSVRTLESSSDESGVKAGQGETDIFIYPPYQFKSVDMLLTNFHLPQSTLLMLVSALADRDLIMAAYERAVAEKFRFFSYGDCMLII